MEFPISTCHWCHVMERESFEDQEVAAILNEHFVAIKVDREERPDVDHIYMNVCQAMTGQGGWPLTILMTPEQKPFFAGTYFPKHNRAGRTGLVELLQQVHHQWALNRLELEQAGNKVVTYLQAGAPTDGDGVLDVTAIDAAVAEFRREFDSRYGGFGSAPKFPTPHSLIFLLRHGHIANDSESIRMATKTLDAMARGGIYDHVGFGFARYSTDGAWLVPHFEKMLYDNALLALAYLEAYQVTGDTSYAGIVRDIFTYVSRDMRGPEGGFYSAEDADSEGEEGKFYVWSVDEVLDALGEDLGTMYCRYYGITGTGNFEGRSIPNRIGRNLSDFAGQYRMSEDDFEQALRTANQKLFEIRERRVHPHKDDKVLTAWNGLMIAALAKAGRALGDAGMIAAAEEASRFVLANLKRDDGRLLARYRDGDSAHLGYLDDYAFLIWALIELYEATFAPSYLKTALALQRQQIELFWDAEQGGYYLSGSDAENLIVRPKERYDGAAPSGNSVATLNMLRLSRMTGQIDLEDYASKQIETYRSELEMYPTGFSHFLTALLFAQGSTQEIVIAGDLDDPETKAFIARVQTLYLPLAVTLFHPSGSAGNEIEEVVDFIAEQRSREGKPTIYICEHFACRQPLTDLNEALGQLRP